MTTLAPIRNRDGELLDVAFVPPGRGRDVVVVGHGVTANKDRPFLVTLADGLAAAGFGCLRLSFAGNGGSEGRFEDATISKEVEDLGCAIDAVAGLGDVAVHVVGHSMGGAVGVLRTAKDDRVQSLVSLAGMARTAQFSQRKFGQLQVGDKMWNKPECPLSQAFLDDMSSIGDVFEAARTIRRPWLLVHGTGDDVVPPGDSRDLVARAREQGGVQPDLVELDGADHLFSAHTPAMVEAVVGWFQRQRNAGGGGDGC